MNPLHVTAWAEFYRSLGWNPLPSRCDRKGPALPEYACYRDGVAAPDQWFSERWFRNVQLCLGVPWKLLVVDVDGHRALEEWCHWQTRGREWPETWTVRTKGGRHYYYQIPPEVTTCPTRKIWLESKNGLPVKHSEIQIMGDKALAIAPPSRHVDKPHPVYAWMHGRQPSDLPLAIAPRWLLECPEQIAPPRPRPKGPCRCQRGSFVTGRAEYDSIEAIPELTKLELARSWGLRLAANHANHKGWVSCHALDREDEHPSASLHLPTGIFWQAGATAISFPRLAVALGAAYDLREAYTLLGIKPQETAR
jgi:Bifunctional DNA primase/polymerase, N-terminal